MQMESESGDKPSGKDAGGNLALMVNACCRHKVDCWSCESVS